MPQQLQTGSTPDYTMGYGDEYLRFLARERAQRTIDFLRPQLRPGLRLLDIGCGPGQVTAALAEAVAPGEAWGIDMEPSQVELARANAAEHGCGEASFEVADGAQLPFDDGSFDVVSGCDVLAYVPEPAAVLGEAQRVLRPGGLLFCREMIIDSSFVYPGHPILDRGWQIFAELLAADDGHPQMGKELFARLLECGYTDARVSMTFETFAEAPELEAFFQLVAGWFLSPEISGPVQQYGVGEARELHQLSEQLETWRQSPGAVAAIAFGQAVAAKR